MIGYVTIGALDSEASGRFYDAVLGACGSERKFADGGLGRLRPEGQGFALRLSLPALQQGSRPVPATA